MNRLYQTGPDGNAAPAGPVDGLPVPPPVPSGMRPAQLPVLPLPESGHTEADIDPPEQMFLLKADGTMIPCWVRSVRAYGRLDEDGGERRVGVGMSYDVLLGGPKGDLAGMFAAAWLVEPAGAAAGDWSIETEPTATYRDNKADFHPVEDGKRGRIVRAKSQAEAPKRGPGRPPKAVAGEG